MTIEAGDWPAEGELRALAGAAIAAAVATLDTNEGAVAVPPRRLSPARGEREPRPPSLPGALPQGGREASLGGEISILFTDDAHICRLNSAWRSNAAPTNVLSFPQASGPLLGDIVLAFETVRNEAALAGKPLEAHMAHLIIHGFLHLLGYDHVVETDADKMEALERAALARMGIADPYAAAQLR